MKSFEFCNDCVLERGRSVEGLIAIGMDRAVEVCPVAEQTTENIKRIAQAITSGDASLLPAGDEMTAPCPRQEIAA